MVKYRPMKTKVHLIVSLMLAACSAGADAVPPMPKEFLADRDAVLVLTTSSSLYQPYIDLIWEYLLPIL